MKSGLRLVALLLALALLSGFALAEDISLPDEAVEVGALTRSPGKKPRRVEKE